MADEIRIVSIFEKQIQQFVEQKRPPVEVRGQVDLGYSFDQQTLDIFGIRSEWDDPQKKIQSPVARAKYVKSRNVWKIYWMRANGKWELYDAQEEVETLVEVFKVLEEDQHGCFWG